MNETERKVDPTTAIVRQFVESRREEIRNDFELLHKHLYKPIIKIPVGNIKRNLATRVLEEIARLTEDTLSSVCQAHSIDWWMATVRRLPLVLENWPQQWLAYATLAILKWSNWEDDTTVGSEWYRSEHRVTFNCGEEQLFETCRVASLGRVLAEISHIIRWLGKGARVKHKGGGIVRLKMDESVKTAVAEYERRRPEEALFAEEGVFMRPGFPHIDDFLSAPIMSLGIPKPPLNAVRLKRTGESLPIAYYYRPVNYNALLRTLSLYNEALEDLFDINAEQILAVLMSFSRLVLFSSPVPDDDFWVSFDNTLNNNKFAQQFSFMVNLCRKGYVRFPESHLRESLGRGVTRENGKDARIGVNAFFRAFCLPDKMRRKIDVRTLRPFPLVYTSPGGQCYFDWLWMNDFLRYLVVEGKEWFSSQHGDVFTLRLKTYLEAIVPGLKPIKWKQKFSDGKGRIREVDLLIKKDNILLAVECKAFAKNKDYWTGHRDAIAARGGKIREAIAQAKDAALCVQTAIDTSDKKEYEGTKVEWAVCLPSQEFLMPLEKHGMLQKRIPRVCTPSELVEYFAYA